MKSQSNSSTRGARRGTTFSLLALLTFLMASSWSTAAEAQVVLRSPRISAHLNPTLLNPSQRNPTSRGHSQRTAVRAPAAHCGGAQVWVPGHFEVRREAVREPGCTERVWVPARYRTTICGGRRVTVKVSDGYYKTVFRPGAVRYVNKRVFVPGHYAVDHTCADNTPRRRPLVRRR